MSLMNRIFLIVVLAAFCSPALAQAPTPFVSEELLWTFIYNGKEYPCLSLKERQSPVQPGDSICY